MLDALLESGARPATRNGRWTFASALAHTTLIAFAVWMTARDSVRTSESHPLDRLIFTVPRTIASPAAPQPATGDPSQIQRAIHELQTISVPSVPRFDPGTLARDPSPLWQETVVGTPLTEGDPLGPTSHGVYSERVVDRIVAPHRDNPQPEYPSRLRLSSLEGEVIVRFVVDTAGRVEPTSIVILQSTHALFGDAVRSWLRRTRYDPAQLRGQAVRQLVEQRVGFTLRP